VTITRERHAFEGQSLVVISSIRQRGMLFALAVLPDGSRSLIPADWTDWSTEQAKQTPARDAGDGSHDLGRLCDLLHLRKIIDALYDRYVDSVSCKESCNAIEPGLSRRARSSTEPLSRSPADDGVGPDRRGLAHRCTGDSHTSHRPHALEQRDEGGKR
jgi:hypothetical protein